MNDIAEKLKQAGVAVPSTKERIWNHLKAHPGILGAKVSSELKISLAVTWHNLATMVEAGTASYEFTKSKKGRARAYYAIGDTWMAERPKAIAVSKLPNVSLPGQFDASAFVGELRMKELLALRTYLNKVLHV